MIRIPLISVRRMFLIDGLGALFSALMTGAVLPQIQFLIGLPHPWFTWLALPAIALACYSMGMFLSKNGDSRSRLLPVILGNCLYCLFTAVIIFYYRQELKLTGYFYFISEIMVIGLIVWLEIRTYRADRASGAGIQKQP